MAPKNAPKKAQYTDIQETSKIIGLSVTSLRKGYRSGRFPYIRAEKDNPHSKIFFDIEQLKQVLAAEAKASIRKDGGAQ